jgi:pimeloyl-ACP methyl ester carboxylesterase
VSAILVGAVATASVTAWYGLPGLFLPLIRAGHRAAAGLKPHRVRVGSHEIHYLAGGEGETVLLLHGIFGEKEHWNDFARHLTRKYRLVVPDVPGFGASTRSADASYGYAAQVGRLVDFIEALGLPPLHVAGSSMGGTLAALLAMERPQQVRSVAFIGAPHGLRTPRPSAMDRLIDSGQAPLVPRSRAEFDEMLALVFERRPFLPYPVLHAARRRAMAMATSNFRLWREQLQDRYLLQQRLADLRTRTAAFWGECDQVFDASGWGSLRRLLPEVSGQVLPGVGHLPMMEAAAATAGLYARFLAEGSRRST